MFVKICGVTNEEDALLAAAMGADAVGFIFAPSPRQVTVGLARDIAKRLPSEILTVGVFRDQAPSQVVSAIGAAGLTAVQLHGHETPADARWVRERVPVLICAFPAGDPALDRFDEFGADVLLLDSHAPGSGQVFDWSLAEGAPSNRRLLLAGGLTPDNVAEAVTTVRPWGVDVASGVESEPGRKDPLKVQQFIKRARAASPRTQRPQGALPFDWMTQGDL